MRSSVARKDFLVSLAVGVRPDLGFSLAEVASFFFMDGGCGFYYEKDAQRMDFASPASTPVGTPKPLLDTASCGRCFSGAAGAFLEDVNLIHGEMVEMFDETARPADFDGVKFGECADTKVNARVVVRIVAGTGADFVDKNTRAGSHGDAGAEGIARRVEGSRGS